MIVQKEQKVGTPSKNFLLACQMPDVPLVVNIFQEGDRFVVECWQAKDAKSVLLERRNMEGFSQESILLVAQGTLLRLQEAGYDRADFSWIFLGRNEGEVFLDKRTVEIYQYTRDDIVLDPDMLEDIFELGFTRAIGQESTWDPELADGCWLAWYGDKIVGFAGKYGDRRVVLTDIPGDSELARWLKKILG